LFRVKATIVASNTPQKYALEVTVDEQSGRVIAAYFHVRGGKSAKTKVLRDGLVLADYGKDGKLIGVELLGTCDTSLLDSIPIEKRAKNFVRNAAPRELLPA
jgi:hypothetical protein